MVFNFRESKADAEMAARNWNGRRQPGTFEHARAEQVGSGWTVAIYDSAHKSAWIVRYI